MKYIFSSSRKYTADNPTCLAGIEMPLEYLWGLSKLQALLNLERMRQYVKRSGCNRILSEKKDPCPTIARQVRIGEFDPDCPQRQVSEVVVSIMEDIPFSELKKNFQKN